MGSKEDDMAVAFRLQASYCELLATVDRTLSDSWETLPVDRVTRWLSELWHSVTGRQERGTVWLLMRQQGMDVVVLWLGAHTRRIEHDWCIQTETHGLGVDCGLSI